MEKELEAMQQVLKSHGQEQIMKAYERLSNEEDKKEFLNTLKNIDFDEVDKLFAESKETPAFTNSKIEPIDYVDKSKLSDDEFKKYNDIGTKLIKAGKLAIVTMAGGQGTRLGHNGPKGTFDLGLDSHKPIFEILTDTIREASEEYGVDFPWYIMTSDENDEATQQFFEEHDFFGYPKSCVKFFRQGKLPMLDDKNGKILINEKGQIKMASDGHGGIFGSLARNGMVEDMKKKNIEWVFVGGVDNVLVKPVDPVLIGLAVSTNATAAGKSVVKASPEERVGVFCMRDGRPSVIEYTEISKEMSEERDENGELKYGESHILCNLFSLKAIEKASKMRLPYHVAHKKADYLDENGKLVKGETPNAYKFESFLFDAFGSVDKMAILRVKREDEFAPVKNKEGVDSPETARKLYLDFQKRNRR